jgi:APA family basic amino acid/polyamine antiporter
MSVANRQAQPAFQQRLGLFDATMLVAGTMIGSGIFIVSADIARDVGSSGWLLVVWILTGVMTVIGALSYAELAAMMPHAGGQYVYLREAYSPLWGFLYGWTSFLVIQTGTIAAVGVAFAKFLGVFLPALGTGPDAVLFEIKDLNIRLALDIPWMSEPMEFFRREKFTITGGQLVGAGLVIVLTFLNCLGVREGKWVQNVFTVGKTFALIILIVLGLTVAVHTGAMEQNFGNPWHGMADTKQFQQVSKVMPWAPLAMVMVLCGAMVGSLFSADAWNNVTFTAGEVRNPKRNLPLSLAIGTGLVILLYLLANCAYLTALPLHGDEPKAERLAAEASDYEGDAARLRAAGKALEADEAWEIAGTLRSQAAFWRGIDHARDDRVGTAVLERVSPRFGVPIMAIAIMVSTFGCLNGLILMGPRLYYAMGQDRLFFRSVGRLNPRGVPAVGLLLQGAWSILLIFSGSYSELLDYVIFAALFFYMLTVAGLFVLRRKMPDAERPYRAFGYPLVPALYVGLCAVIMVSLLFVKPVYSWPSFLIVLSGFPVYFLWRGAAKRTVP